MEHILRYILKILIKITTPNFFPRKKKPQKSVVNPPKKEDSSLFFQNLSTETKKKSIFLFPLGSNLLRLFLFFIFKI